jgi:hypothetical protein
MDSVFNKCLLITIIPLAVKKRDSKPAPQISEHAPEIRTNVYFLEINITANTLP